MLRDRGATHVDCVADPVHALLDENGLIARAHGGGVDVRVYLHAEERVGVKFARQVVEECREEEATCGALIVSTEGPTPFTRRECEGKGVQFMLASELCVTLVDHCLVPKHERVADVGQLPCKPEELPKMFASDRVAQYYDWSPGTVVRITRVFGGHEPIPYYRLVVSTVG